jgi:hypothetical protein
MVANPSSLKPLEFTVKNHLLPRPSPDAERSRLLSDGTFGA